MDCICTQDIQYVSRIILLYFLLIICRKCTYHYLHQQLSVSETSFEIIISCKLSTVMVLFCLLYSSRKQDLLSLVFFVVIEPHAFVRQALIFLRMGDNNINENILIESQTSLLGTPPQMTLADLGKLTRICVGK